MSYELIILDLDATPDLGELLEEIEQTSTNEPGVPTAPLSNKLTLFFADVNGAFPSLEEDPEVSPWSITPTGIGSLGGSVLGFAVANSDRLFDVFMEFEELAWRHDLIICDPQEGTFRRPRDD